MKNQELKCTKEWMRYFTELQNNSKNSAEQFHFYYSYYYLCSLNYGTPYGLKPFTMQAKNTAILIFDEVEVLDFAGPYEVFYAANESSGEKLFNVFTIADNEVQITARNGLKIIPDYSLNNSPAPDILILPGGNGRRTQMNNPFLLSWIKEKFNSLEFLLSVCTGAFIIANTGLLNGLKAATHHSAFEEFEKSFPDIMLVKNEKFADNGKIITAAGVSSGINMSLHVIKRLFGSEIEAKTADYIEFNS